MRNLLDELPLRLPKLRLMRGSLLFCALILSSCAADTDPMEGDGDGNGNSGPALEVTGPERFTIFYKDALDASGRLVATASTTVTARDASIVRVEVSQIGGDVLANLESGPEFEFSGRFLDEGELPLVFTGFDAEGNRVGAADIDYWIAGPQGSCQEILDLYGVNYTVGPEAPGVADPITIQMPLAGIAYRFRGSETLRSELFMDCSLAQSLAEAAPELRDRNIVEVVDIGVYNYRCIGGGTPPDCPNGVSQHALAKALDIHALVDANGDTYSVLDDWVIDEGATCPPSIGTSKDDFLNQFICEMKALEVWNIILTPNFDRAHRDHFHVDLTTNGDFMR